MSKILVTLYYIKGYNKNISIVLQSNQRVSIDIVPESFILKSAKSPARRLAVATSAHLREDRRDWFLGGGRIAHREGQLR